MSPELSSSQALFLGWTGRKGRDGRVGWQDTGAGEPGFAAILVNPGCDFEPHAFFKSLLKKSCLWLGGTGGDRLAHPGGQEEHRPLLHCG